LPVTLGTRPLKEFDERVPVFAVQWPTGEDHGGPSAPAAEVIE
jgi:hypothetical protein